MVFYIMGAPLNGGVALKSLCEAARLTPGGRARGLRLGVRRERGAEGRVRLAGGPGARGARAGAPRAPCGKGAAQRRWRYLKIITH